MQNTIAVQMTSYVRPEVKEYTGRKWVLNGVDNQFFQYVIDRYNGSPTNRAIIDSYAQITFGFGLTDDNLYQIISKKDLRKIVKDYVLFGMAYMELHYKGGKIAKIYHAPTQQIAPAKANDNGDIDTYFYCYDWKNTYKYKPEPIDAYGFGKGATKIEIYCIKEYEVGQFYFANPSYLSGLPYAELEEEIANYCINHIKNGLSFGHVININSGKPESEEQLHEMSRKIINKLTGSTNAGKFLLSFNDNKEVATTVEPLTVSDAHQQYQFLSEEARTQICVSHKVVSGAILGINKSTGFSSNAEEIETAFNETLLNVIQPIQEVILDAISEVTGVNDLGLAPLRESMTNEAQSGDDAPPTTQLKKLSDGVDEIADALIAMGEDVDDEEWELIDEMAVDGEPTISETALQLAKTVRSTTQTTADENFLTNTEQTSEQDTSIFKVRYAYAPAKVSDNSREFCKKMVKANKVYRKEDIDLAGSQNVNPGFGPNGADNYNIWLYKGGARCRHFWMRKIYLKRNNRNLSVSQAQKLIMELDPSRRASARPEQNDPLVAKRPTDMPNNGFLPN